MSRLSGAKHTYATLNILPAELRIPGRTERTSTYFYRLMEILSSQLLERKFLGRLFLNLGKHT